MYRINRLLGFTLIEIILAMAILGIILAAFLPAFTNGFANIITMGKKTQAVAEAQAIIDFIYYKEGEIDHSVLTSTFNIEDEVDYTILKTSPYNQTKPIYYSVEIETIGNEPIVEILKVTVLVFYQNGKRYITLSALIPLYTGGLDNVS